MENHCRTGPGMSHSGESLQNGSQGGPYSGNHCRMGAQRGSHGETKGGVIKMEKMVENDEKVVEKCKFSKIHEISRKRCQKPLKSTF